MSFDVALALRRVFIGFWLDFAPIVLAGFAMVSLPGIALALIGNHAGSTIVATLGGMLHVLYVVIVSNGALARLRGSPRGPSAFVREGFANSPKGLSVALLLGAGFVGVLVALLLAGVAGTAAVGVRLVVVAASFAAAVVVAPAVPLALVAPVAPLATLTRAAALTGGNRVRIATLLVIVALAIVPARVVLAASVYSVGASAATVRGIDAGMTLASPGLWLLALADLLAWGLAAVVPAVVFVGLAGE